MLNKAHPSAIDTEGSKLNERGITLQTVIVTAVLALAAAGAGIVIFNVINTEATELKGNAGTAGEVNGPCLLPGGELGKITAIDSTTSAITCGAL